IPGAELVKRVGDGELLMLVEVKDAAGHSYRDSGFVDLRPITPDLQKKTWVSTWRRLRFRETTRLGFFYMTPKAASIALCKRVFAYRTLSMTRSLKSGREFRTGNSGRHSRTCAITSTVLI